MTDNNRNSRQNQSSDDSSNRHSRSKDDDHDTFEGGLYGSNRRREDYGNDYGYEGGSAHDKDSPGRKGKEDASYPEEEQTGNQRQGNEGLSEREVEQGSEGSLE
jgi:hypothetical protein